MSNKRKRSIADRLNKAQVAINNTLADTEILNRATEYGFDETKMQAGLALFQTAQGAVNARKLAQGVQQQATVNMLEAQTEAQEATKGAAQQATQDQHAALDALDDWLARFIKIARVALADKPQLLEKLGIIVK